MIVTAMTTMRLMIVTISTNQFTAGGVLQIHHVVYFLNKVFKRINVFVITSSITSTPYLKDVFDIPRLLLVFTLIDPISPQSGYCLVNMPLWDNTGSLLGGC